MDAVIKKTTISVGDAPKTPRPGRDEAEEAVRTLIAWTGDDPDRPGLLDTPRRVIDAYAELYSGYDRQPEGLLETTFDDLGEYDDLVLVRDIPVNSHCEHHMMPFVGTAHIAYYPVERVAGLSKLARLVDAYARRLQSQERLSFQIMTALEQALKPRGLAVMIEAEHTCMTLRGIRAHGAATITTQYSGTFREEPGEQSRFLTMVGAGGGK